MIELHNELEIERRFVLLSPPDRRDLDAAALATDSIDQTYLGRDIDGGRRRLRRIARADGATYVLSAKRRLAPGVASEAETALNRRQYKRLLAEAGARRRPVRKTRWHLPADAAGVTSLVVDHIFAPAELWVAEAELDDPALLRAPYAPPAWLGPTREVTFEPGWSCSDIARAGVPA